MSGPNKKTIIALGLCTAAALATGAGAARWRASGATTDNAYVRGDITTLSPKVGGYVVAVAAADNQQVKAGDILVRIDDQDYKARLAQADANLAAAQARLLGAGEEIRLQEALIAQASAQRLSALADLDLARRDSERRRDLIRSSAVSQAQLDQSNAARAKALAGSANATAALQAQQRRASLLQAQQQAAKAALDQAIASRDLARIDLENTVLRAPVDGVVGNRQVRLGRLVTPGAALLDVVPVHDVWVVANFKETQLGAVKPGARARIRVDGRRGQTFDGVVDSLAPGSGSAFALLPADNATGNFVRVVQRVPVKIRFSPQTKLEGVVPGLSARVDIQAVP
jgi:membrane fusion protein (multidrug efflux system)